MELTSHRQCQTVVTRTSGRWWRRAGRSRERRCRAARRHQQRSARSPHTPQSVFSLHFFSVLSSVSSSSVVSGNAEVTCCSMTVRPLSSHTRYWGPSQTFVTKTGGVKYITDQVRGTYS